MTCENFCHQGRQKCPTPYTCGIYSIDSDKPVLVTANSDGSSPHGDPFDWIALAARSAVVAAVIFIVFAVIGYWSNK